MLMADGCVYSGAETSQSAGLVLTVRPSLDNRHFKLQPNPPPMHVDVRDHGLDSRTHTHTHACREAVSLSVCPLAQRKQLGPHHLHLQTLTAGGPRLSVYITKNDHYTFNYSTYRPSAQASSPTETKLRLNGYKPRLPPQASQCV